jgi:hypothetical protein
LNLLLWKLYYCFASCICSTSLSSFFFFSNGVKALAMWWHFLFVCPQPMLIKELM